MSKSKHPSLKEARGMMTQQEIKLHVPPFLCNAWWKRKMEIQQRVKTEVEQQKKIKEDAKKERAKYERKHHAN